MIFRKIMPALLMIFAMSAHADTAATSMKDLSKCGLLESSNLIDGYAMTVCPQNVYMQIKQSFLGDDARAFFRDSFVEEQKTLRTDSQRFADERNQTAFSIANNSFYKFSLFLSLMTSAFIFVKLIIEMVKGDVALGSGKRYSLVLSGLFSLFGICMLTPIGNLSAGQYLAVGADNIGVALDQPLWQRNAAQLQRGNLETQTSDDIYDPVSNHPQTQYKAEALTMSALTHSLLIRRSSQYYRNFAHQSKQDNYENMIPISKIVKREGNKLKFEVEDPETPGLIAYSADPYVFNYVKKGGVQQNTCLAAIGFDKKYSTRSDIDNIENDVIELKNDIVQSCITDTSTQQYQAFLTSMLSMYVSNLTSNWLEKTTYELYTSGKADELATIAMHALCADDEGYRLSAKEFIKTHRTGDFNCVGADWKVMGDAKDAYSYQVALSGELIKIAFAYKTGLLKIQGAMLKAFQNPDSDAKGLSIVQQGFLGAVQDYNQYRDDQLFSSNFLSNFNDNSLGTFITSKCVGGCVDEKWLKVHANYSEEVNPFNVGAFISTMYMQTGWTEQSSPTLDAQAMTQTLLIENSGKNKQSETYENASVLALENPSKTYNRCMNSSNHAGSCLAMFGSNMTTIGIQLKELAMGVKFAAGVAARISDERNKNFLNVKDNATAQVGKKAKEESKALTSVFGRIAQYMNVISELTDAISTLLISIGLVMYVLIPALLFAPFQLAGTILSYYVLITILFMPALLLMLFRLNDANNMVAVGKNVAKYFGFLIAHHLVLSIAFIGYITLSDIVLKSFYPVIEVLIGSIVALIGGEFMQFVAMMMIRLAMTYFLLITCLYITLNFIATALSPLNTNLFFISYIVSSVRKLSAVANLLGGFLPGMFTATTKGVGYKAFEVARNSFRKRGD